MDFLSHVVQWLGNYDFLIKYFILIIVNGLIFCLFINLSPPFYVISIWSFILGILLCALAIYDIVNYFTKPELTKEIKFMDEEYVLATYKGEVNKKGKQHGNGKMYDHKGNLIVEGQFLYGEFARIGKVYDSNSNLIFEGTEIENNKVKGIYYDDEIIVKEIVYDKITSEYFITGNGKIYNTDGGVEYKGQFLRGIPQGIGRFYYPNGGIEVEGVFKDGEFTGEGNKFDIDGNLIYAGTVEDGYLTYGEFDGGFGYRGRRKAENMYSNSKIHSCDDLLMFSCYSSSAPPSYDNSEDNSNFHHVEPHQVDGYQRTDGTEVEDYWRGGEDGYDRSNPDGIESNNLQR